MIGPINKISEGVYSAEGETPAGEKIYFGMELIDDDSDKRSWDHYARNCNYICQPRRSLLDSLGTWIGKGGVDLKKMNSDRIDMEESEFLNLLDKLKQREIYFRGKRWETLHAISGGIEGFLLFCYNYVAYVSDRPIKGRASLPQEINFSLKNVFEVYQKILMSVGVKLHDKKPVYETRGIFRNPRSLVEGGYSNISILLLSFTAKVMKIFINAELGNQAKLFLTVQPIDEMENRLINKIRRDRIKIDEEIPEELKVGCGMPTEKKLLISLDDLANLHE